MGAIDGRACLDKGEMMSPTIEQLVARVGTPDRFCFDTLRILVWVYGGTMEFNPGFGVGGLWFVTLPGFALSAFDYKDFAVLYQSDRKTLLPDALTRLQGMLTCSA